MRENKNQETPFVPGMLTNMTDIKLLICYLLKSVGEPMDKEQMIDMIFENDLAEYFDLRAAVMQLVDNGNINESSDGILTLSDTGREAAEQLETTLPFTAREKVVKEGIKITTLSKRRKANKAQIIQTQNGIYVSCELLDDTDAVLSFKLLVSDDLQAKMIKEKFLENPALVYKKFITSLIEE